MTTEVLTVEPDATLEAAAAAMAARNVGAVVVTGAPGPPAIVSERAVLTAVADGVDCGAARVRDHAAAEPAVTRPDRTLEDAAATMLRHGSRHLVVEDADGDLVGVIAMRDIVRLWLAERKAPM